MATASLDEPSVIGVVHLSPLPGTPRNQLSIAEIIDMALRDAIAYQQGGASAIIVENFGDVPFPKERAEPHTIAAMALAVRTIVSAVNFPVGVNVLRNDAQAAMGIAAVGGAGFIRVNVHTGVMITDQGIIEGRADHTVRYQQQLGARVEVWADVLVKHGVPLGPQAIEDVAHDAVHRGLADAVIVTGSATGRTASPDDVSRVRGVLPRTPVYVGSGVTPELVGSYLPHASGFIVGSWAKVDGRIGNAVDPKRVRRLVDAVRAAK